jgi:hypothetical protein
MSTFWNDIRTMQGKSIPTVTGRASFVISNITEDHLTVLLASTGKSRAIERQKFEPAFAKAGGSMISPKDVREWDLSRFTPPISQLS